MPVLGRHARPSPRYRAAGVLAVLGVVAACAAVITGATAGGMTTRTVGTVALAVTAVVVTATAVSLVVHRLTRADGGLADGLEESVRHLAAVRRDLTALAGQVAGEANAAELARLRAETARLAATVGQLQQASERTADTIGQQMQDLGGVLQADRRTVQARLRALEAALERSLAQAGALRTQEQLRLAAVDVTLARLASQLTQLRGQTTGLGATVDEVAAAGAAGRADLARRLAAVETHLEALAAQLTETARQVVAARAEQEGRAATGQASAVRMTLPLVRAALRRGGEGPGSTVGDSPAGDVGQVTYAAPRTEQPAGGATGEDRGEPG